MFVSLFFPCNLITFVQTQIQIPIKASSAQDHTTSGPRHQVLRASFYLLYSGILVDRVHVTALT